MREQDNVIYKDFKLVMTQYVYIGVLQIKLMI